MQDDDHVLYSSSNYGYRARLAAYSDAQTRNALAEEEHPEFFTSEEHRNACDESIEHLNVIFDRKGPDYQTARGLGRQRNKPFTSIKYQGVGHIMGRWSKPWKEANIYMPLRNLGITNAKCNLRGEFVYRVYVGPEK